MRVRALQKSTFHATHLIFRSRHDVTGIRMKQRVHLYLPASLRFALKQKNTTRKPAVIRHVQVENMMENHRRSKRKQRPKAQWLLKHLTLLIFTLFKLSKRCPLTQHGTVRPVGPASVCERETVCFTPGWCLSEAGCWCRRDQSHGGLPFFPLLPININSTRLNKTTGSAHKDVASVRSAWQVPASTQLSLTACLCRNVFKE